LTIRSAQTFNWNRSKPIRRPTMAIPCRIRCSSGIFIVAAGDRDSRARIILGLWVQGKDAKTRNYDSRAVTNAGAVFPSKLGVLQNHRCCIPPPDHETVVEVSFQHEIF
jgi:hypothetical protein